MSAVPFDPRPLVEPVDRNAVREYTRRLRQSGAVGSVFSSGARTVAIIMGAAFFIVFGSVFITVAASILSALASIGSGDIGGPLIISAIGAVLPILVVGGAMAAIVIAVVRGGLGGQERWYRLSRFAAANGMTFLPSLPAPALPGMIFNVGGARSSSDLVRGEEPRFVEFANYQYTTGSGKNRTTHRWGYVAIKLDVPLPNIVLDATSNNSLFGSNLPATFDRDQKLSLEGDFDQHFSLYCPEGYEQDALYLFTPDIMARFIDHAAALDVEIVDDWLFLYGKREFSSLDPATWAWLFSVVAALLDKFAQWARWRDEKLQTDAAAFGAATPGAGVAGVAAVAGDPASATATALPFAAPTQALGPPPGVALSGRRLKRGVPWGAIVVLGVFAAFWLAGQFGLFEVFFGMLSP
ncbi:hypothetical protein SAMN04487846_0188 [Microbacterium sp. cf046]|uniref:hypothetical protein n=1 Tax=Microbacterium sp. cf046 TaxID=1761803 RepID=UPI0008EBD789|nr:hypothetical protein [Microbacterium sp. cf046]SFR87739.1 hypothetical protein SAMN04487846_0188 [Microbacterium sp. cf046]